MINLLKGAYWSVAIHACAIGAVILASMIMSHFGPGSLAVGIMIGGGGNEGGSPGAGGSGGGGGGEPSGPSGADGAASSVRDVSDIVAPRPSRVTKPASASRSRLAATQTQQSPTGPPVLAPQKLSRKDPAANSTKTSLSDPKSKDPETPSGKPDTRPKETQAERLARIRRGARPISTSMAKATGGAGKPSATLDADAIRDRLLSGLKGTGPGSGSGGSGSGRGTGGGSGSGGGGSGRGTGSGTGSGDGGSGHGSGGGQGDGTGPGSGIGDPFFTAIHAALYEAWAPPSRAEVGGGNPTADVKITLRSDGTVTAYQLSRPSGNAAMNASVEALLRTLRRLPAPASFGFRESVKVIEVRFSLDSVGRG